MIRSARAGTAFAILFFVSLAVLGELLGSFADPDRVFVDHFADGANRVKDIIGSILLVLAGWSMLWFAIELSATREDRRASLVATAALSAGAMIAAGLALATVPLSISFGDLFDDPGLRAGQAVLPQFGSVALEVGAMPAAAAFVVVVARIPGLLPRWLRLASYPVAAVILFLSLAIGPMVLLAIWFVAVSVTFWRVAHRLAGVAPDAKPLA